MSKIARYEQEQPIEVLALPAAIIIGNVSHGVQTLVRMQELFPEQDWREYVAPAAPEDVEQVRLEALQAIDNAAIALDARVTTIGGNQALEYAYRAQQIERWDLDPAPNIDDLSTPAPTTIMGQEFTAPPRYKWGLLRCYWQGQLVENPEMTLTDAINKIRLERDKWLYVLDLRAAGRLGETGKPAVRMAQTVEAILAARDTAVALLNSIASDAPTGVMFSETPGA